MFKSLCATFLLTVSLNAAYADSIDGYGSIDLTGDLTDEQALELGMTPVADVVGNGEKIKKVSSGYALQDSDLDLAKVVIVINKGLRASNNPNGQTISVYKDGVFLHEFNTSTGTEKMKTTTTGRKYRATTPLGVFRPKRVYKKYQSYAFTGARMDYATFFNGGIAIHSTTKSNYPKLGKRASGGCARLKYEDAETVVEIIRSTGEGHGNIRDESFYATKRGKRIKLDRLLHTDREKLQNFSRYSGVLVRSKIWTYDAAIVVVTRS